MTMEASALLPIAFTLGAVFVAGMALAVEAELFAIAIFGLILDVPGHVKVRIWHLADSAALAPSRPDVCGVPRPRPESGLRFYGSRSPSAACSRVVR